MNRFVAALAAGVIFCSAAQAQTSQGALGLAQKALNAAQAAVPMSAIGAPGGVAPYIYTPLAKVPQISDDLSKTYNAGVVGSLTWTGLGTGCTSVTVAFPAPGVPGGQTATYTVSLSGGSVNPASGVLFGGSGYQFAPIPVITKSCTTTPQATVSIALPSFWYNQPSNNLYEMYRNDPGYAMWFPSKTQAGTDDAIGGAVPIASYHVRRGRAAYGTGPALDVQYTNGGTIYTVNYLPDGKLDYATLDGDTGLNGNLSPRIVGWYDDSGSANKATTPFYLAPTMNPAQTCGASNDRAVLFDANQNLYAFLTNASAAGSGSTITTVATFGVAVGSVVTDTTNQSRIPDDTYVTAVSGSTVTVTNADGVANPAAGILNGDALSFTPQTYMILPSGVSVNTASDSAMAVFRVDHSAMPESILQLNNSNVGLTQKLVANTPTYMSQPGAGYYYFQPYPVPGEMPTQQVTIAGFVGSSTAQQAIWGEHSVYYPFIAGHANAGGFIGKQWGSSAYTYDSGYVEVCDLVIYARSLASADVQNYRASATNIYGIPSQSQPMIVVGGDSISEGKRSVATLNWPRQLEPFLNTPAKVYNTAISGTTVANWLSLYYTQNAHPMAAIQPVGHSAILTFGSLGTNDISAGTTDVQLEALMTSLVALAKADNWTSIVLGTITPATGEQMQPNLSYINNYNAWLRSNYRSIGATALIDFANDPQLQNPNDTTCYPDGLHLTSFCYGAMARDAAAVINPLTY